MTAGNIDLVVLPTSFNKLLIKILLNYYTKRGNVKILFIFYYEGYNVS